MNRRAVKEIFELNGIVRSRDGKLEGVIRGHRRCQLESCGGDQVNVLWPDGERTWPCLKGMVIDPDGILRIE